ncbi:MAG: hypothetical protein Q4E07_07075, partial [Eubacteriales bacterium]|nr:hypothetical protein [Eubacteriales bacterium]
MSKKRNYLLYAIIVILAVLCVVFYVKYSNLERQMHQNATELVTITEERDNLLKTNKELEGENKQLNEEKTIVGKSIV